MCEDLGFHSTKSNIMKDPALFPRLPDNVDLALSLLMLEEL